MKLSHKLIALSAAIVIAGPAHAVRIDFDDLPGVYTGGDNFYFVNDFYNGGTDSYGNVGPDYGVSFSHDEWEAFSGKVQSYKVNYSFSFINFENQFTNYVKYRSTNLIYYGTEIVRVYSGLNGTGTLLKTYTYPGDEDRTYTRDHMFRFGGRAQSLVFSDADFIMDYVETGTVPEPSSWAMIILGFGVVGASMRRKRAVQVARLI